MEYDSINLLKLPFTKFRSYRTHFQMIFQHPDLAFNPRHSVRRILSEPLSTLMKMGSGAVEKKVKELMNFTGIPADALARFPHQLSGGQKQRLAVARAMSVQPELIIADEPTSSLDAVHKKNILELLDRMRTEFGLTLLLISHDLSLVGRAAERIAVMYRGKIVEIGPAAEILKRPLHPYTMLLVESARISSGALLTERKYTNEHKDEPAATGCAFYPRCAYRQPLCREEEPVLPPAGEGRLAACHFAGDISRKLSQ